MFARNKGNAGIRKKQLDNSKPKLRFKTSGMKDNRDCYNVNEKNWNPVLMEDVEKFFNGEEVAKNLGINNGNTRFNSFENADPDLVSNLLDIPYLLDSKDRQGSAPNAKRMLELAKENNAELIGYWIPKSSRRVDARITLSGFKAKISDEKALELKDKLQPDEFMKQGDRWRFWWD